jgi:hypothetical protein
MPGLACLRCRQTRDGEHRLEELLRGLNSYMSA